MGLNALRGALGFLSRLPVGADERDWEAFRQSPWTYPVVGYVLGGLMAIPLSLPAPATALTFAYLAWVYALTGITHLDGLADAGDALAAHGDAVDRRAVMKDADVGTGGVLAVGLALAGLALAGLALAARPTRALGVVVAAEVGAKLAVATLVCLSAAPHEGLGSAVTDSADASALVAVAVAAAPVLVLTWPRPAVAGAVLAAALVVALAVERWAERSLGGASGDVLGATNELARVVGLHVGVVAWTRL